jgi:hypothetical protein
MVVAVDMPKKFALENKHLSYDDFLSYIIAHDTDVLEDFIYLYQMKQDLINKNYSISSAL